MHLFCFDLWYLKNCFNVLIKFHESQEQETKERCENWYVFFSGSNSNFLLTQVNIFPEKFRFWHCKIFSSLIKFTIFQNNLKIKKRLCPKLILFSWSLKWYCGIEKWPSMKFCSEFKIFFLKLKYFHAHFCKVALF